MVERAPEPCPFCTEIPNVEVEGEEMPRELRDTVEDLMALVGVWEEKAQKATSMADIQRF